MQTGNYQRIPQDERFFFHLTFRTRIFPQDQLVLEIHNHFLGPIFFRVDLNLHRMSFLKCYLCVLHLTPDLFLVSAPDNEQLCGKICVVLILD
jgi:hypothetical protein